MEQGEQRMTKEELEEEAKEYAIKSYGNDDWTQTHIEDIEIDYIRKCIAQSYLTGAEPREKRIADLEAKLEQTEKDLAEYQFNYPTIKELEKENAELKEKYDTCLRENTGLKIHSAYVEKKLTKAKELLKQWVELYKPKLEGYPITPIQEQTEQFLNSEVEK